MPSGCARIPTNSTFITTFKLGRDVKRTARFSTADSGSLSQRKQRNDTPAVHYSWCVP
jgi:hypothetical protein